MHQTTVRFGSDLWADLEREAAASGVSVAQYVRDAATARVHYSSGRRGDDQLARALELAETERGTRATRQDAKALAAEGRQVRRRAAELRTQTRARLEALVASTEAARNEHAQRG